MLSVWDTDGRLAWTRRMNSPGSPRKRTASVKAPLSDLGDPGAGFFVISIAASRRR